MKYTLQQHKSIRVFTYTHSKRSFCLMINIMIDIRYISRYVIQIYPSPQTIALAPYMSRIYHQLPPKKTRGPDVAVSVSRLIFMRCHDNVKSDTTQSSPECRTDTTIRAGNRIYTKCHITPSSTTCFKPSDYLMYNLNNGNPHMKKSAM